jgi:dienelactone hydrolase
VKRINAWLLRVSERDRSWLWLGFAGMLLSATPFYIASAMDLSSGLGLLADIVLYYSAMLLANMVGSYLVGCLLWFIRAKLPRIFTGGVIVQYTSLFLTFYISKVDWIGSSLLALLIMGIGYLLGSAVYLLFKPSRGSIVKVLYIAMSFLLFIGFYSWLLFEWPHMTWTNAQREAQSRLAPLPLPISAPNPGDPGDYQVHTFTYGSGYDRLRERFADQAEVVTATVDASAIIKNWDWSREWLWGYGIDELPLNGTVWMPEGSGRFPIALIVHGNHSMADFSDTGYDYLGEQLASRGYIAVSVDENFINHSTWEGGLDTLSEDMTIRAWLLLQHLIEIEKLDQASGNPFSGKVDMERITLIGHSRGGQAAVLASTYDQFFAADEYEKYRVNRNFGIDAVIAIAPTDTIIYDRTLTVNNINYLLLQGSNDADVTTFAGDRQYKRIKQAVGTDYFKTSLYIQGANHGQFNTEWGRGDITHPIQLFLDDAQLIDGEEQRAIARIYISAFMDTVYHSDSPYLPMFKDYRYGLNFLPTTKYVSRYMDAGFVLITDAEEDREKTEGRKGANLSANGMNIWKEEDLKNRRNTSQLNRVIRLDPDQAGATYVIAFGDKAPYMEQARIEAFSFSMGVLSGDKSKVRAVTLQFTDVNGVTTRTSLDRFVPVPGPIKTRYLKVPFLEKSIRSGGLSTSSEPILQTYIIPISSWLNVPFGFDSAHIREIAIRFEYPGKGDIILDEIGYYLSD